MTHPVPGENRRERTKRDKRHRIVSAARELFAEHGVGAVTTQQVADRADVAIGTLYLYVATKAELLIMVQNEKFATAITDGVHEAALVPADRPVDGVLALVRPVVACVREQVENGRTYLHELVFGDPTEPHRRAGLTLSAQLEEGIAAALVRGSPTDPVQARVLARVVTAIVHISTTASVYLDRSTDDVLDDIRTQVTATLTHPTAPSHPHPTEGARP